MGPPYVCATCRRHLFRHAARLSEAQWLQRATFISLSNTPPADAPPEAAATKSHEHRDRRGRIERSAKGKPTSALRSGHDSSLEELFSLPSLQGVPLQGRYSRAYQDANVKNEPKEKAEEESKETPTKEYFTRHIKPYLDGRGEATRLDELLSDPEKPVVEAWEHFLTHFGHKDSPSLVNPTFQDLVRIGSYRVFGKLSGAATNAWCKDGAASGIPRPTELISKYEEVNIMRNEFYEEAIWPVLAQISKPRTMSAEHDGARPVRELVHELMALWKVCLGRFSKETALPSKNDTIAPPVPRNWSCLPDPEKFVRINAGGHTFKDFPSRLFRYTANYPVNKKPSLAAAVLATYDLFTQRPQVADLPEEQQSDHSPFIQFVAHLLPQSDVSEALSQLEFNFRTRGVPEEAIAVVLERLSKAPDLARIQFGAWTQSKPACQGDQQHINSAERDQQLEQALIKRLGRALETQDLRRFDAVWGDAQQAFGNSDRKENKAYQPTKLYDMLVMVAMALKQPGQAINIWNVMVANGTNPTVATWTAMLTGCGNARDVRAMEEVWQRMQASGISPDAHAWTARISGLMSCGRIEQGLQALDEMGQRWVAAAYRAKGKTKGDKINLSSIGDLPQAPKPATGTLNAVVTALARGRKHDMIGRAFAWGRAYGIKPDAITFNILIRLSLREDKVEEAMKLLKQMESLQIQPDVATLTIILDAIFRSTSLAHLTQPQQTAIVASVLHDLASGGLEANAWVFSTLVDGLLKYHNNVTAASAVLNFMAARDVTPSPHVHTILITHYFAQTPPDLAAVEALWNQIQLTAGPVDLVFFDRMVEGYARAGDVGKMMTFLAKMSREGRSPGWHALCAVVRALAEVEDWARLEEVVEDVRKGEGVASEGFRGSRGSGQDRFWGLVEEYMGWKRGVEAEGLSQGGEAVLVG